MSDEYGSSTRMIGRCRLCNDNSELRGSPWGAACDVCIIKKTKEAEQKDAPIQQVAHGLADGFSSLEGSYLNLNGVRYELSKAPKVECHHKMLDWLNEGPVKCPFCPQCAMLIYPENLKEDDERNPADQDSNSMAEIEEVYNLPEGPRSQDADEGMAGLHGGDITLTATEVIERQQGRNTLGHRTEAPRRDDGTDETTDPLAEPSGAVRIKDPSGK